MTTTLTKTNILRRAALMLLALIMTCATAWAYNYNAVFTISAATPQPFTFSGNQIKPIVTWVTITDDNNNVITQYDQNQFTVTYGTNINAGETRCEINVRITAEGAFQDWVFTKYYPIAKRPMFVNINNCEKHYGEADPTFTWQLVDDNDVQQDSIYNLRESLLPRRLNGHLTRTAGEDMGDYTISYDGTNPIELANYQVTVNDGTLTITDPLPDSYIFSVNADSTEYTIRTVLGWNYFCDMLDNSNKGIFTGKTVKLGTDIGTTENPVSRMAGSESKPFTGHFDGQNNTITFSYNTGNDPILDYIAPFRYVMGGILNHTNHATISNLYVDSHIVGVNSTHLAGLIANLKGLVDVTNCHVQALFTCTGTATDSYCAGLVSHADLTENGDPYYYGNANDGTLTISGCTVSGSILTYGKYAGGFVGMAEGKTSIENSVSGVTIRSFVSGDGTHGGFIGLQQNTMNYTDVKTTIEGCLFNGKLINSNEVTTQCGGFIGWHDGGSLDIKHCLYAPAHLYSNESEISDGSTFVGNGTVGSNCIYTRALGTAQGKATRSIEAGDEYVTISNIALISLTNPDVYNVSGITSYDWGGISCGGNLYICEGAHVSLVLSNDYTPAADPGYVYGYTATGGQLAGTANPYTLTMPDADVTINVDPDHTFILDWGGTGTESDPYMIYNKEQLDLVASRMYQSGNTYQGDFFKLGADIVYPYTTSTVNNFTPIGNGGMNSYPAFHGTFDGNGHTISGIRINADYLYSNEYYFEYFGLFGELYGTVKNVILADAVITGSSNLGGIVGHNYNGTIKDNLVIGTTISATDDYGAICGSNDGTLERNYYVGCTVAGRATGVGVGGGNSSSDMNGARSARPLTLGENITATGESVAYQGTTYYASNTTVTLGYNNLPASYTVTYSLNGTALTGNTFTMPANDDAVVSATVAAPTYTKAITAYHTENEVNYGWYLIASPIGTVDLTNVPHLFDNQYDLYYFDQTGGENGKEWKNHKAHTDTFTTFASGQGYLYANSGNITLEFTGAPYNGNGEVAITNVTGDPLSGWNLVGNPFAVSATLSQPYYRMNDEGSALNTETEETEVAAMEGVFVQATEAYQSVTFTPQPAQTRGSEQSAVEALNICLGTAGTSILDNAILRFDGGQTLEKFSFREGSTKLYIPQNGKEYAIVNAETQTGEIPVNFKAESNGTYTLNFTGNVISSESDVISSAAKKSIFTYLHLIDNLTGADIDLLTPPACGHPLLEGEVQPAPSYTFTAKTTDYESRFRLVFSTEGDGPSTGSGTFAFISDGNIIVNGEGMLQVVDVMGRIMMQEENATSISTSGMTPGVYVLRLINGENVRTQKIVMR